MEMVFPSASQNQLKKWLRLTDAKFRREDGLFLAEGVKVVEEVLKSDWLLEAILVLPEKIQYWEKLIRPEQDKIPVYQLTRPELKKLSQDKEPEGIITIVKNREQPSLSSLLTSSAGHLLILHEVNNPGNLGALMRSAYWFGFAGIILGANSVDFTNPKVIRASMGSIFHLTILSDVDLNNIYWGTQIQVIFQPTKGSQGDIAVQISSYLVVNEMQKLAERYADSGDFGKAIEQIKYVLSIDSEHPDSRALLEAWTKKQKEILEEEKTLNELIETEPGNTEGWGSKAEFLIGHKRYDEALYALDEVIRITPNFINSLSSKRQLSSFSELCDFNPEYVKAICKKSFVLYQLGMYKEALGFANKTLEIEPDHVGALSLKASSLLKLQRFQEAFELVAHALDLDPKNSELLFLKGKALLKFHKYEEGLEYLEKAYQLTPKKPEVLLRKGYALSKLNRFEEALKVYDKIINLQPDNTKALSNKGFILIMTGKYEDALSLYNGLIQLNPFNSILWSKKGAILTKMHRSEEALKAVDRALEIVPNDSDSLFTRGYIYSKNGMYDEALRHFNSALELDPYDQKALAKKAFMLSRLGKHDEAFIAIEDALKINWHNSRTWYYKGVLHYNIGDYDKALSAFNRSAELNLEDTRIERMKQFTLVKLGMPEGKTGVAVNTLKVEEELFDRELQEEYELEFED